MYRSQVSNVSPVNQFDNSNKFFPPHLSIPLFFVQFFSAVQVSELQPDLLSVQFIQGPLA
jgi:hypothetical protein